MLNILISIIGFLLAIGILVVFHEFGHFWVARRLGVKVLRFSVGFGKPLFSWKDKKQTEFVIAAIPLGGYVKMVDEREGEVSEAHLPYAFNRKSVWARILIVLAGPLFNFIFAILAYWLMFMIGISGMIPLVGEVKPNSIAMQAGITPGAEIVSVDREPTHTWQQVIKQLMTKIGDKDYLHVETKEKSGITRTHFLDLRNWELKGDKPDLLYGLGVVPYELPIFPRIQEVVPDEPANKVGILAKDVIVSVDDKPIHQWKEFTDITTKSINKSLKVTVLRQGETIDFMVTPRAKEMTNGEVTGFVGLVVKTEKLPDTLLRKERLNPYKAFIAALQKTKDFIVISFSIIGKMIIGDIGLHTLSGPITIAQGAGATLVVGFQYYLSFLALISISLGVLNLLPIPILDGGHLLFYCIEIIIRRPVPDRFQVIGYKIGLMLLIFLMVIAFYNDLLRLM